jgi:hypothetical protein
MMGGVVVPPSVAGEPNDASFVRGLLLAGGRHVVGVLFAALGTVVVRFVALYRPTRAD